MSIDSRSHQYGTVFGHWRIQNKLGQGSGGKSAVFLLTHAEAEHIQSALKVVSLFEEQGNIQELPPRRLEEYRQTCEDYSRQAQREVLLMNDLQGNSHIVDYLDHTFVDWSNSDGFGRDMLIRMEKLEDLRSKMRGGKIYTREEIIRVGLHICDALSLCHSKGILHRDIKPGNIFINKDGNFKLGDFGISRILDSSASYMASTGIGTPQYWAPEQISGTYDNRVDIYSLGLVLYEMANDNRLPFAAGSYIRESELQRRMMGEPLPAPVNADEDLASVILQACAYNPDHRFSTAAAFRNALNALPSDATQRAVGGNSDRRPVGPQVVVNTGKGGTTVKPEVKPDNTGETKKKKKWLLPLLAILAVVLLLAAGLALRGCQEDTEETDPPEKETTEATAPPEELAPVSVIDAYNTCVPYAHSDKGYFCYHIPQVELENGAGADVNNRMYETLYGVVQQQVENWDVPGISQMYYSWGRNKNVVSILVETQATAYDDTNYYIYNLSAKSGKVLDDAYVRNACGVSQEQFRQLLEQKVREYYALRETQIIASVGESTYNELISKSLAEDNLNSARPYVDSKGFLCAMIRLYWYAGADTHAALLSLTGSDATAPECNAYHDPAQALKAALAQAKVGDIITFGSYEQDNRSNGTEPIQWRVLAKENGRLLVVSEYGLENMQFHHTYTAVTWETCSLRGWLNSSFYTAAFSDLEKTMIPLVTLEPERNPIYGQDPGNATQDYVFLLSTSEAERYFVSPGDRLCAPTAFAKRTGRVDIDYTYYRYGWWWLRNVGELPQDACCVNGDGTIDYKDGSVNHNGAIVRPAIWINCN